MPYGIKRVGSGFKVYEKAGGKHPGRTFSSKALSRRRALAQERAIEMRTHGK